MALRLLREQMMTRDPELLVSRVALKLDYLHTVDKGSRHRFKAVCRADEEAIRKVEGHLYEMIAEIFVLLGVKHLKKRRSGVPAPVRADLVYLVKEHQRILCLHLPEGGDYPSRH